MSKKLRTIFKRFRSKHKLVRMGVAGTHLLPTWLWVRIREEAAIVRRMDYEAPIYMCVDSWIEHEVRSQPRKKEPGTVEWIESWFKPGDVLYDVGANIGVYSLVTFAHLSGDVKIYAFEPGFMTFPQLCRNIQLNGANQAITPFQVALSDQTSVIDFHYQNLTPAGALHALGAAIDQYGKRFEPVFTLPTLTYRLDDFVRQFGLALPNHIKIDVDGTELGILKGAEPLLAHPELRSVLLELNDERGNAEEIVNLLQKHGLVLHSQRNENSLFYRKGSQP